MSRHNNSDFRKPNNSKKAWGDLFKFSKKHLPMFGVAMALSIVGTVFTIIGPDKLGELTNVIAEPFNQLKFGKFVDIDMAQVGYISMILLIYYLTSAICNFSQGYIMATITQKITKSLRKEISQKINRLPLKYFDNSTFGDVLSRVTNDVDMIGESLNRSVLTLITALMLFIGVAIAMFITNWIMAFAAIGSTIIGFALMFLIMAKSQKYFVEQQEYLGKLNGHIEEVYSGHNVISVFNEQENSKKLFSKYNTKLFNSAWKSQFLSGIMMPIMSIIGNLGFVAVCVVGGVLVKNNIISIGVIVSFMIYVRLFMQPLNQLAQSARSLQSTSAASERVFEFLREKELTDESRKTKKLEKVKGDVSFENVRFGYDKNKIIIKDFSAEVKAGQKIAIVGPTGAGKTTMVNLLMRFYELNSGRIKIDGVPIDEITRENVHSIFGMVLQDTWLFEGTIKENLVYGKNDVTKEQLDKACEMAGLDHFIKTLPKGYDTVLDDKASLSAGQKQLMTIARAMIENAPMLILDEATSSVDTRTEVLIQNAMDSLANGRTSFVIAHRLSTIKNADLILVMKDGDIIEKGTHENLMSQNGFYADLYNSQFSVV